MANFKQGKDTGGQKKTQRRTWLTTKLEVEPNTQNTRNTSELKSKKNPLKTEDG